MASCSPVVGFHVKHFHFTPPPDSTLRITISSMFTTLEECQTYACREFKSFLTYYLNQGHSGIYHDEIDLYTQGLITAYVHSRDDHGRGRTELQPLSEFVIEEVTLKLHKGPMVPHTGREDNTEESGSAGPSTGPLAPGPVAPGPVAPRPVATHPSHMRPGPHAELENGLEWAQTRVPWPARRDDGPFRSSDDELYSEIMGFAKLLEHRRLSK